MSRLKFHDFRTLVKKQRQTGYCKKHIATRLNVFSVLRKYFESPFNDYIDPFKQGRAKRVFFFFNCVANNASRDKFQIVLKPIEMHTRAFEISYFVKIARTKRLKTLWCDVLLTERERTASLRRRSFAEGLETTTQLLQIIGTTRVLRFMKYRKTSTTNRISP